VKVLLDAHLFMVLPRRFEPQSHKGPFDRLLVAQALAENMPLVSADSSLDTYGIQRIW
jgi:PIN domain nuclease of toxin-antitoxin system